MNLTGYSMNHFVSEEERTLFLGDLSIHCTREDILRLFAPFGAIERITLKVGVAMTGLGYGFIAFANAEQAYAAMQALQGTMLLGRALRIKWATPKGQPNLVKTEPEHKTQPTAEVHFSYLTKQVHFVVTEEILRRQYERFGDVMDIVIKRSQIDSRQSFQKGYGFVRYGSTSEGFQSAITAKKQLHQVTIEGILYETHFTHAMELLLRQMAPDVLKEEQHPPPRHQQQYLARQQQPQPQQHQQLSTYPTYDSSYYSSNPIPYTVHDVMYNVYGSSSHRMSPLQTYGATQMNPQQQIMVSLTEPALNTYNTNNHSSTGTRSSEDRESFSTYYK